MKTAVKGVILGLIVTLGFLNPWLFIPAGFVAGLVAGRVMSGKDNTDRRLEKELKKQRKASEKARKRDLQIARDRFYSKKEGWKAEALPVDMTLNCPGKNMQSALLDVDGMKGIVRADYSDEGTRFSLLLKDDSRVKAAQQVIRDHRLSGSVFRSDSGECYFISDSPEAAAAVARAAYPSSSVDYKREVTHNRQYIVEGCASYEEALEKFKLEPDKYPVRNSSVSVKETVGSFSRESQSGQLLDKASIVSLPTGAYVITESTVSEDSATVRVPGDLSSVEDIRRYAVEQVSSLNAERTSSLKSSYSNGTPEGVTPGNDVELSPVSGPAVESLLKGGVKAYVVVDTATEAARLSEQGLFPRGANISIGTELPEIEGKYVVSVDISSVGDMLKLRGADDLSSAHSDAEYLGMKDDIVRNGYASVRLGDSLSLGDARINGTLAASEVASRVRNSSLDVLDDRELSLWMKDAAQIESVQIKIDSRSGEMRVTSRVGGQERVETRPLSTDEIRSLEKRGTISSAEMKDFLMQSHPSYFETYRAVRSSSSVQPKSVYKDPVSDFIAGRKPERAKTAANIIREARQKKNQAKETKRSSRPSQVKH